MGLGLGVFNWSLIGLVLSFQALTFRAKKMSSNLQTAMEGLISVFHSYSAKEGDKYKLCKAELKNLLQGELSELLNVSELMSCQKSGLTCNQTFCDASRR